MLRSRRYKYIRDNDGDHPEQLFDMEIDPLETRSLMGRAEYANVLKEHRQMLDDWMRRHNDPFVLK